ncbi:MAG TPA: hypothetical protein VN756_13315 [Solirubrobacterales bacterium]|nr:hypothetical protein [Solirubrobacterales bacterium]
MTQYDVKAFSIDAETGEATSETRIERIDVETNELFHGCAGPWDVEDIYSAFWNRLNASWERDFPAANHDKVVVVSVVEV